MAARFLGWTPRDTAQQLQNLAKRTAAVTFSKYALIVLAALLIIAVFSIPAMQDEMGAERVVFSTGIQEGEAGPPVMKNPRYEGVDARNQPYVISAQTAEQQEDKRVLLKGIQADITLANGHWFSIQSDWGLYNPEKRKLSLKGNIQAFYDEGYDMRTSRMDVFLKSATAEGDERVEAQGPLGTLVADGFRIDQTAQYVQFTPNVKVKLRKKGL